MRKNTAGFTVLEFLVAAFILVIVIGSSLLLFKKSSSSFSEGKNKAEIYQDARECLGFIGARLKTALVNDWENNRINFIGQEKEVKFIGPFSTPQDASDICKMSFYLEGKEMKIWLERMGKKENDYSFPDSFPGSQTLISNIQELIFEYYDRGSWQDSWDSGKGGKQDGKLPKAVRVKIEISAPQGVEGKKPIAKTFSAITYLENSG